MKNLFVMSVVKPKVIKIPQTVKIGPHRYDIHEVDGKWTEGEDAHGKCNTSTHEIWINNSYKPSHTLDTVIHEHLHAIWNQYDLNDKDEEEAIVHRLATGIVQTLVDNPELLKYINKMIKEINNG